MQPVKSNLSRMLIAVSVVTILFSLSCNQSAPQKAGRYIPVAPPQDNNNGFSNFIWVLDSQTGEIKGYRFAQERGTYDNPGRWTVSEIYKY